MTHASPPRPLRRAALTLALLLGPVAAQSSAAQNSVAQPTVAQTLPSTTAPAPAPVPAAPASALASPLDSLLLALRSAPGWRSADLTYRAAQLQLDSARLRAGLNLTAGGNAALTKAPWEGGDWTGNGTLTLSASLPVLPWSPLLEGVRSAERGVQTAALDLRGTRAGLTTQLWQAYAGLRAAGDALTLADAQLALSGQLLAAGRDQRAQGLLTESGLLDRQANLEAAQAGRDRAARAVTQARAALTRLLGTDPLPATPDLSRPLPDLTPAGDEATLIARALERRPEVRRAQATLADALAARDAAALAARLPDLTASVSAGQLTSAAGAAGRTVSGSLNLTTGVLGAQVSVPLREPKSPVSGVNLALNASIPILGSTESAALRQAELGVQQATLALDVARQGAELDVRTRMQAAQDERGALDAARTRVRAAELTVQAAQARLDAGLATRLDVAQAKLNLTQATQALSAQLDRVSVAGAALAQATADLDPLLLTIPALPTGGRP
ncbi:TolC family protein [Deinococcus sp. PEB2-63]